MSNTKRIAAKPRLWLTLAALALAIVVGVLTWRSWSSPKAQLDKETTRAKQILERFEDAIDPEKLRAWALPLLTGDSAKTNATITPPDKIRHLVGDHSAQIFEDSRSHQRFVCLWIHLGGFGPYERIVVGSTNATIDAEQSRPSWVQLKWRDGIYYQRWYP